MPVQVDERAVVDLNQPFNDGYSPCSGFCFPLPPSGTSALQYASTHTGADPDATADGDEGVRRSGARWGGV